MKKLFRVLTAFILIFGFAFILEGQSFKPVFFNLKDIKDVSKTAPTTGQVLAWNASTLLWTPTTVTGTGDMVAATWGPAGYILPAVGGTGINTSGSTGLALVTAGTWSVSATPTFTTAHITNLIVEGGTYDTTFVAGTPSAAVTYTLPAADGSASQFLQTNGSAALSWATVPSLGSGTTNYVAYWTSGSVVGAEQYLSTSRGGIGISTAASTGVPKVTSGVWSITSQIANTQGGTGVDSSGSTGLAKVTSGTWSFVTDGSTSWNGAASHKTTEDALTGLVYVNGAGTYTAKAIGTDVQAYHANLAAISGATWTGASSITTLGTIATGVWSGTEILAAKGGTGQTAYTVGDFLYASSTSALSKLGIGAVTTYLKGGGTGYGPSWATLDKTAAGLANVDNTSDATKDAAVASLTNKTGFNGLVITANTGAVTTGTWNAGAITSSGSITTGASTYGLVLKGSGSYNTTLIAGGATANKTYTLPLTDGSNGQALVTNGSAVLSWTTVAGSGDMAKATYDTNADNFIDMAAGGTGVDSNAWTGYPYVTAGVWAVDTSIGKGTGGTTTMSLQDDITAGAAVLMTHSSGKQLSDASGSSQWLFVNGEINQSGTAGYTGLYVLMTETATGSGTKNLMDLRTNAGDKFAVSNAGAVTVGSWTGTAVAAQYGGTGQNTSGSTGVPSISSGTWSVASTLANTLGGTGQTSSGWTGYPYVTSGTWAADTIITKVTNGIKVLGASSQYATITHDGTNTTLNSSTGAFIMTNAAGSGAASLELSDGSSNYITITSPSISADYTLTLPTTGGTANYAMITNGSGTLSFSVLPVAGGGTAIASYTIGDTIYASGTTALSKLAAVATGSVLGSGGVATAPSWISDLPTGLTIGGAYVYRAGGTDVAVGDGGTGLSSYAVGDIPYASGTGTIGKLADVTVGSYLRSGGVNTAPLWSTLILPNSGTIYKLPVYSAANTIGELAAVGATGEYLAGATGAIPAWATLNQAAVAGLTTASGPTFDHLHLTKTIDFIAEVSDGNSGTSKTIDFSANPCHSITLTGNCTFTFTAPPGPTSLILRCIGDGTARTSTWPSTVKWAAATKPTHTGTLNSIDLIAFYFDGTNYWAGATLDIR